MLKAKYISTNGRNSLINFIAIFRTIIFYDLLERLAYSNGSKNPTSLSLDTIFSYSSLSTISDLWNLEYKPDKFSTSFMSEIKYRSSPVAHSSVSSFESLSLSSLTDSDSSLSRQLLYLLKILQYPSYAPDLNCEI